METEALREAGLTEGEVKVYLALLKLGASTTGPIIEEAGVARSFAPHLLESLIAKGLVSYVTKQKTKQYQAAQPSRLLNYIDERRAAVDANRILVQKLIPSLSALTSSAKSTNVEVFEGFKGVATAYERVYELLPRGSEYVIFGISSETPGYQHAYWEQDHKRRVAAGIRCRLLFNRETPPEQLAWRNKQGMCEARYMAGPSNTPSWFLTYGDIAIIGLQTDAMAIIMQNAAIAQSFRANFEELWKESRPAHTHHK